MTTHRQFEIENQISDLLAELSAIAADDGLPRSCPKWVAIGSIQDVEGEQFVVCWSPDGQLAWEAVGLMESALVTEREMIRRADEDD